ncbi:altered inheritance of mitochondria protein 19 [Radiomyces spectabilis]|uniref:altered inheritance of mitochondria protein 19 n=1 Tax=Radiomyces spectabilis TaxID=64574 RepID=UPI00221F2F15|nr:altered inheritance of mitochondria protein 19 [Radiomyces spectabilis]KAI8371375.1 altered inheritance of mitochondria protein 19 [Radiomyces spectabilis]
MSDTKTKDAQTPPLTWIDKQANSPFPIWALSAASFATVPMAVKNLPGMPSLLQSMAFGCIFAGAGYVTNVGDPENGAGIATAWCLSWAFLNARKAIRSCKPVPLALVTLAATDAFIYGRKTLQVNGYI